MNLTLLLGFEHLMVLVLFREDKVPVVPRLVEGLEGLQEVEEETKVRPLRMGVQCRESLEMDHLPRGIVDAKEVETSPLRVRIADRDSRPPHPRGSVPP